MNPRVIYDTFVNYDGSECIIEVYESDEWHVVDFSVYRLTESGEKGECLGSPAPLEPYIQIRFEDYLWNGRGLG